MMPDKSCRIAVQTAWMKAEDCDLDPKTISAEQAMALVDLEPGQEEAFRRDWHHWQTCWQELLQCYR